MIRKSSIQEIRCALVRGDIDQICADTQTKYGTVRNILSGVVELDWDKHKAIVMRAIEIIEARSEKMKSIIKEVRDEWAKD